MGGPVAGGLFGFNLIEYSLPSKKERRTIIEKKTSDGSKSSVPKNSI